jgi:hypothetical protein
MAPKGGGGRGEGGGGGGGGGGGRARVFEVVFHVKCLFELMCALLCVVVLVMVIKKEVVRAHVSIERGVGVLLFAIAILTRGATEGLVGVKR